VRYLVFAVLCLAFASGAIAQKPAVPSLPSGAKLFVAPMEWNLDRFVTGEIERQALPVQLVGRAEDADFVMTSVYQSLGSHFMSPGHYVQVKIAGAGDGKQIWFAESNDYALFFGRLRPHGPHRVAEEVVRKLHRRMSAPTR
jgi:hypothetical protein